MDVATLAQFEALEKRIRIIEAQAKRNGSEWIPIAQSPMGARKTRRLIAAGKFEASRVGRKLYVRIADVDAFMESRIVKHDKPAPVAVESGDARAWADANLHLLRRTG
jgi:hypothetical protein